MAKMKKITAMALAMIMTVALVACGGQKTTSVVGTWGNENSGADMSSMEFKEDGTGTIQLSNSLSLGVTYTTEDGKLKITMTYFGETETDEYTYQVKNNKLILTNTDGAQVTFDKK